MKMKAKPKKHLAVPILVSGLLLLLSLTACGSSTKEVRSESGEEQSFSEFSWPRSDIAALIPVPESNIGRIDWEASYGFVVYVSETSKEDYSAYVDGCWDRGFTINYSKGDNYFWADNVDGYKVTVRFEKNDVMFIRMDEPEEGPSSDSPNTGARTESGFDPTTNQTITFWGIEFSFPAYFDVRDEDSTEETIHYYPEEESYYATLLFEAEDAGGMTLDKFNAGKSGLTDVVLEGKLSYTTEIRSEETTVAGLPGWRVSYRDTEIPSTVNYCIMLNPDSDKLIIIYLVFDDKDQSNYDYLDDYQKMLSAAKAVSPSVSNGTPVSGIRPEFKEAMESYEAFFDEYAAFMKKYANSDNQAGLLSDYLDYMSKYTDAMTKMDAIGEEEMSDEELMLYADTMNRITASIWGAVQ